MLGQGFVLVIPFLKTRIKKLSAFPTFLHCVINPISPI